MGTFLRGLSEGLARNQRRREHEDRLRQQQQRFEEQRQTSMVAEALAREREDRQAANADRNFDRLQGIDQGNQQRAQRAEDTKFAGGVSRGELAPAPLDLSEIVNITNFAGPSPTNPVTGETGFAAKPERVLEADQVRSPRGGVGSVFDVISSQERVEDRFGTDSPEADAALFHRETGAFLPKEPAVNPETSTQVSARLNQAVIDAEQSGNPIAVGNARSTKNRHDALLGDTREAGRADEKPQELTSTERRNINIGRLNNAVLNSENSKPIAQMGFIEKNVFARKIVRKEGIDPESVKGLQMAGQLRAAMSVFEPRQTNNSFLGAPTRAQIRAQIEPLTKDQIIDSGIPLREIAFVEDMLLQKGFTPQEIDDLKLTAPPQ